MVRIGLISFGLLNFVAGQKTVVVSLQIGMKPLNKNRVVLPIWPEIQSRFSEKHSSTTCLPMHGKPGMLPLLDRPAERSRKT